MKRLLVTGCARSGTGWLSVCLTAAGVPCGHEARYGLHAPPDVGWVAESSWLAAPHTPWLPATHVVRLVRHPLAVIRSNVDLGVFDDPPNRYGRYALDRCPQAAAAPTPIARAAVWWREWNRLVVADETVRLDDVTPAFVTRLARTVNPDAHLDELPEPVNVQADELRGPDLSWADVDGWLARDAAVAYGYRR